MEMKIRRKKESLFLILAVILESVCSKESLGFISSYLPSFWQQVYRLPALFSEHRVTQNYLGNSTLPSLN